MGVGVGAPVGAAAGDAAGAKAPAGLELGPLAAERGDEGGVPPSPSS